MWETIPEKHRKNVGVEFFGSRPKKFVQNKGVNVAQVLAARMAEGAKNKEHGAIVKAIISGTLPEIVWALAEHWNTIPKSEGKRVSLAHFFDHAISVAKASFDHVRDMDERSLKPRPKFRRTFILRDASSAVTNIQGRKRNLLGLQNNPSHSRRTTVSVLSRAKSKRMKKGQLATIEKFMDALFRGEVSV